MAATNIPIIVQGNSFNLAIPLQIYVIQDNEMVLQDYTPLPTDDVSIQLKGCRRNYTYTPTIEGNVAKVYLTGNELADNYSIVVSIVKANGERLRSFRTDQFFIVESSDDLTQADIIAGLEDNVIYLQPQYFIAGEDGRGIISVTKTATSGLVDTYTITYTDNTTSTFQVTNGALQPVIVDIEGDVTNAPDEEDLTSVNNGNHDVLKFNDKAYMPTIASGMGRKYLRKNFVNGINKLTQAMFADANTIYHIQYDYDLDGATITMPTNSALKIDGGKIDNGKIVFQDTSIESDKECFGEDLEIEGKVLQEANPDWFVGSDADKIEKAINTFGVVKLAARDYLIDRTINVQHSFALKGCGIPSNMGNYATPSKSDDYSSSRLIPIAAIDSILACVAPSGRYVSFVLSGVSFVRPTSEAWYNDYKSLTTNVNGFAFSTPGGPSRPIVIENCNFKYLNYGIYIYDYNPSLNRSTDINNLYVTGCNISFNNQGIHIEGKTGISGAKISDNVIEDNSEYGIYCCNPSGSTFESYGASSGYIEISNNLMEGQTNPLYISLIRGTILWKGNYLETSKSAGSTITVIGKQLTAQYQTLILDSGVASTNITKIQFNLSYVTLIDNDSECMTDKSILSLNGVIIKGTTSKKIKGTRIAYTPVIGNNVQPFTKINITPTIIFDEKLAYRTQVNSYDYYGVKLTEAMPAGDYIVVAVGKDLRLMLHTFVSGTDTLIFDTTGANPGGLGENKLIEFRFTLPNAVPAGGYLRLYSSIYGTFFSGFAIYPYNENGHKLYSFDPNDYLTNAVHSVANPVIGLERYDKSVGKPAYIQEIANGSAVWKDAGGFTPAISKGFTSDRPTSSLTISDGGFKYYDIDLSKVIFYNRHQTNNSFGYKTGSTYISNPIAQGTPIQMWAEQFLNTSVVKVIFAKSNQSTDEGIELEVKKRIDTESAGNNKIYYKEIAAPDPTVYPYIWLSSTYNGYTRYNYYNISMRWDEYDGATAGVARSGDTASRPASTDIYTGFQYWDTDLGKMIAWNGSAWVNLDGSALS